MDEVNSFVESACMQIIAAAGNAKSLFIEACDDANKNDVESAKAKIAEAKESLEEAHKVHLELITKEANNELGEVKLLLVHAEDQMMSSEIYEIMANKFVDLSIALSKLNVK